MKCDVSPQESTEKTNPQELRSCGLRKLEEEEGKKRDQGGETSPRLNEIQ